MSTKKVLTRNETPRRIKRLKYVCIYLLTNYNIGNEEIYVIFITYLLCTVIGDFILFQRVWGQKKLMTSSSLSLR